MRVQNDTILSTAVDVTGDIERQGFSLIPGADLLVPPAARDSLQQLADSFHDLPLDPYMPDGSRYRYRRYTCYTYERDSGSLTVTENGGYFQTVENNPFAGGAPRKYEEVDESLRYSPFLAGLIAFGVDQLPPKDVNRWLVQLHTVRIVAREGELGRPTPEGVHRDGYTFISLHMVTRHNVTGGGTQVCDETGAPITSKVFTDRLDSLYGEDARIRHGVEPVALADPRAGNGYRDMLLMSYDPQ
ncbi:2OG-Fe dioxygenase family protein [Kitasatospora sp. NBC_01266]|uniref:2OG-Fe dioxygenase family protein n=1 Tax=Kitasatospora sp. NBC_01266 TaxID=2903572 RepID=UPI002E360DB4|nr:2OG-Fe dioxygenase family protein [Kitasatospora sp. NBC_01266]